MLYRQLVQNIPAKVMVKNSTRKALKDCRMQLILKAQFEAMSRYEHISDRKVPFHKINSFVSTLDYVDYRACAAGRTAGAHKGSFRRGMA